MRPTFTQNLYREKVKTKNGFAMPLEKLTLETSVDAQKARVLVLKALDNKGYKIEEESEDKIVAKHSLSASYYPHSLEVCITPENGKTTISAVIDHRAGKIYLERLSEELRKVLPLPALVLNPMEKPATQEELEYQAKILNRNLNPDEQILWSHVVKKGVLHKEVAERWIITNIRAIKQYPVTKENPQEKFLAIGLDVCDVVVMNQFRSSKGDRVGSFAGTYGHGGVVGTGTSVSASTSKTYGDLVFLHGGREVFRFPGVSDPNGVKRMIQTLRKQRTEK